MESNESAFVQSSLFVHRQKFADVCIPGKQRPAQHFASHIDFHHIDSLAFPVDNVVVWIEVLSQHNNVTVNWIKLGDQKR